MLVHNRLVRLLVILLLLTLVALDENARVEASSAAAIQVYAHGFAKDIGHAQRNGNVVPLNETSTFTQDDVEVYAYLVAAFYSVNFTWQWYNPEGQLYFNRTEQVSCVETPCSVTSNIWIGNGSPANTMFGSWTLDVLADGNELYSDSFSLIPVMKESDYWSFDILQSAPPRVHAYLTVTIHPSNQSWSSYSLFMPYAANVTSYELNSRNSLQVLIERDSLQHQYYTVDFGGPRYDGFAFVLSFDLSDSLHDLSGWMGGQFALTWDEYPWERFSVSPVPEAFNVQLPRGAEFVDVVGMSVAPLIQTLSARPSISFNSSFVNHPVEWTVIYQDLTYRNAHTSNSTQPSVLGQASPVMVPFLPMTLKELNVWAAVMAVFLLTSSELASPVYTRSGVGMLIDRKRLRIAALILVAVFLASTIYQFLPAPIAPH